MKVMKFGGTSVGTTRSLLNVKAVVESQTEPVIVVVSALGGLTDNLIATAGAAARADNSYQENVNAIFDRHHAIIDDVVTDPERHADTLRQVNALLQELADAYDTIFASARALETPDGRVDAQTMQNIVSYGERCSSVIVTAMLRDAVRFDSLEIIKTVPRFESHVLDAEATNALIHKAFDPWKGMIAVAPGFISRDSTTRAITNLGRGGSDYTAAIFAAALNADLLEIWTDVDGFMTADPRQIPDAYVIKDMTFVEAMELCNFGAKVVYPPTIYPVFHKNIPIVIKNTFNPSAPGTRIIGLPELNGDTSVTGISSIKTTAQAIVTLAPGHTAEAESVKARCLNALAGKGVTVLLPSVDHGGESVTMAFTEAEAERAMEALNAEFERDRAAGNIAAVELRRGLATVALVGCRMRSDASSASRMHRCLSCAGIKGLAWSNPATADNSLAVVVDLDSLPAAMTALHAEFFSSVITDVYVKAIDGHDMDKLQELVDRCNPRLARTAHLRLVVGDDNPAQAAFDLSGRMSDSYTGHLENGLTVVAATYLNDDVYAPMKEAAQKGHANILQVACPLPPALPLTIKALEATGDVITKLTFNAQSRADEWMRELRTALPDSPLSEAEIEINRAQKPQSVTISSRRMVGSTITIDTPESLSVDPEMYVDALVQSLRNN